MALLDTHRASAKAHVRNHDLRALLVNLMCHTAEPGQANTPSGHPVSWIKDDGRDICGKIISASRLGEPAGLVVDL
jgi:hypothetical protein